MSSAVCTNASAIMDDFKEHLQQQAELMFKKSFPEKCEKFHKLIHDPLLNKDAITTVCNIVKESCQNLKENVKERKMEEEKSFGKDVFYTPAQSDSEFDETSEKSRKLKRKLEIREKEEKEAEKVDYSKMECNRYIGKIIKMIKPDIRELVECCNTVKTWVQLQIPEIQDGNNFGVEVQEEILEEVRKVEDECNTFLKSISVYHLTRAEIVSKFAKYSTVEDYVCALEQLDVKEFVTLRLMTLEMRSYCLALLDLFDKNMDRILTPRGINNANMLVY